MTFLNPLPGGWINETGNMDPNFYLALVTMHGTIMVFFVLTAVNWPGEIPLVYRWPYDYSKPGAQEDFIKQHVPFSATPESNLPHEEKKIGIEREGEETKQMDEPNAK